MPQKKTVISLGAGASQLSLIRTASELGFDVLAIDQDPNEECLRYVKDVVIESTYNSDDCLNKLRSYFLQQLPPIAVLARISGPAVWTAYRIANHFQLPGVPQRLAEASLYKSSLREQLHELGIPVIEGFKSSTYPSCIDFDEWIIKPDSPLRGKANVYRVTQIDDTTKAFDAASNESVNGEVSIEEYIDGLDVGAMVLLSCGNITMFTIFDELVTFDGVKASGIGVASPSVFEHTVIKQSIYKILNSLISYWKVNSGFVFFTFRVTKDNKVYLYEVNPGLCGDNVADKLIPLSYPGIDPLKLECLSLTNQDCTTHLPPPKTIVVLETGDCFSETTAEILKRLSQNKVIDELRGRYRRILDRQQRI